MRIKSAWIELEMVAIFNEHRPEISTTETYRDISLDLEPPLLVFSYTYFYTML